MRRGVVREEGRRGTMGLSDRLSKLYNTLDIWLLL